MFLYLEMDILFVYFCPFPKKTLESIRAEDRKQKKEKSKNKKKKGMKHE